MMTALWSLCGLAVWAQPQNFDALMSQAKSYYAQKEYAKGIVCYEKIIAEIKDTEYESLMPTIRNQIAINNMYLGVAALKAKDYPAAKDNLEKAIKDAKPESKTFYMAHSWMGQWNSVQALNIRANHGDYEQAIRFSLEAERLFDLAKAPEKRLSQQLSRASSLRELSRKDEAEVLLKQIMAECDGSSDYNIIKGKAAYALGEIEMDSERFQLAISHLEQGYNLCNAGTTKDAKSYAFFCADKLSRLFSSQIPDDEKAALWKLRADELKPYTSQ